MVNFFVIEEHGPDHHGNRLYSSRPSHVRIYYHDGQSDVVDFVRGTGTYQHLPKPSFFIIDYHLTGIHHAALAAIIRATDDIGELPIILSSSTLPDPDLAQQPTREKALQQLGDVDGFMHPPLTGDSIRHLLAQHPRHMAHPV